MLVTACLHAIMVELAFSERAMNNEHKEQSSILLNLGMHISRSSFSAMHPYTQAHSIIRTHTHITGPFTFTAFYIGRLL